MKYTRVHADGRLAAIFLLPRDGLFAAAGVKMAPTALKARQSMLAEVPKALPRQHVNIDSGSSERLVAAAENRWRHLRVPASVFVYIGDVVGGLSVLVWAHHMLTSLSERIPRRCNWAHIAVISYSIQIYASAVLRRVPHCGRLHAFDRKVHFSNHAKQVNRLKHALGAKIAKYFEAEHNNL